MILYKKTFFISNIFGYYYLIKCNKCLILYTANLTKHLIIFAVLKKKIFNILKYITFTALGVGMFWLVYRDQDFTKIWYTLSNEVNYTWVAISLFFGLLSHISRTLRWKIALEPLGEKPRTSNSFIAVMTSYFMNLLLPRMGEFARCALMTKYEKIPFSKLFGTVVTERIIDMVMLLFIFVSIIILEFDKIISFGKDNPLVVENIQNVIQSPLLWGMLVISTLGLLFYVRLGRKSGKKNKIQAVISDFTLGIKSILSMRRYKAYIAHTVFIWLMYYLMLYSIFFSLDFTRHLTPLAGLLTFVFASFGMVAPVQGGIGAWHFMAEKALGLYGIESANGKIFALLAHSSMNLMVVVFGAICLILVPVINRNYTPVRNDDKTT
jgi:uncharacterized protein (TIRG00374 family)